ncbi:unnamed protein product [Amoebophrya sp. A25]|nr:unnamed protein product [Amoebophrya sp. A25]|eukprot:GSA25T00023931001.1
MAATSELFAKLNKWKNKAEEEGLNFEAQGTSTDDRAKTSRSSQAYSSSSSSLTTTRTTSSIFRANGPGEVPKILQVGGSTKSSSSSTCSAGADELKKKLGKWKTQADETALENEVEETRADAVTSSQFTTFIGEGASSSSSKGDQIKRISASSSTSLDGASSSSSTNCEDLSASPSSSKTSSPVEQELKQRLSKWRDKAENEGEKFESVPQRSIVDRRSDDNKLKSDAAEFVPGGLSDMLGNDVAVTIETVTNTGAAGAATWTLAKVLDGTDVKSRGFTLGGAAVGDAEWHLELINSDEKWTFLRLTSNYGTPAAAVEKVDSTEQADSSTTLTADANAEPQAQQPPAQPPLAQPMPDLRFSFFADKQMSVADNWTADKNGELVKYFRKIISPESPVEVGVRWKVRNR